MKGYRRQSLRRPTEDPEPEGRIDMPDEFPHWIGWWCRHQCRPNP
jgi:hypothetical protein